ncbi:MAG: mandelate racemase/muconate lactonizing enzyme family protein [Actinobacteria bacterium]|nr:mandelate racemase/muconate lactonizing enzyme family protein [Actinomycetota bacterium]MBM4225259.1 mandelate racemase/muconate lactonizing enzyme family protein [Gammaproteobacteria bacterium]
MKIADVETIILRQASVDESRADGGQDTIVIRVRTDDGLIGVGEVDSSPEVVAAAIHAPKSNAVVQGLRGLILGEDALDRATLWDRMFRGSIYMGRRGVVMHAMSGIDIALWDIAGQAAGLPIASMLGSEPRTKIRTYASILMEDTPERVAERVSDLRQQGFTACKLGWGPLGQSRDHDVLLAAAAREAAGADMDLMLDAGYGYGTSVTDAVFVAEGLAELGFRWLEEPFLPDELGAYAELTRQSPLPVAMGEQSTARWDFELLASMRAANVFQPDLARCGGITEFLLINDIAAKHDIWVVPHAWKTGILKAASLHVNAVIGGERLQEWCVEANPLTLDLVEPHLLVEDGFAVVPTSPGLGIQLNQELMDALRTS